MSTRNKILIGALVLVVISILFQYLIPSPLQIEQPHVSVRAEPVLAIGASGIHLGHGQPGDFVINNSMIMAVIVMIVLLIIASIVRSRASIIPRGFYNFMEMVIDALYNTFGSVDRKYIARFFPLVGAVFFYVLISNWLALIPGVLSIGYYETAEGEVRIVFPQLAMSSDATLAAPLLQEGEGEGEGNDALETEATEGEAHAILVPFLRSPSADLNNTFMLAVVAFFYIQFWGVHELGGSYFYKFFPYRDGPIGIFTGLVEIISELARVVSFAFRLFGNIFAGEVILLVMAFLLPALQLPFMALEVFIGFIQAFVFAILIMVFTSLATQAHGDHGGEHGHHGEEVPADLGGHTRANPVH